MDLKLEDWPRVKDRFQALLEMSPAAREDYLASGDLPGDLHHALSQLLSAHSEAGSFLSSRQAMLDLPEPGTQSSLSTGAIPCGALLSDRFRIVRFVAKGGMGEVYEAEDLELGQRVALKTIRPEIAEYPGALSRFKREVNLARQVTHPNVCRIFDLFRHHPSSGADTVFLTMELLRGQTLAERLASSGHLPVDEALDLLRQVASALDAAHRAGVLHRDLKPGNIVLDPEAGGKTRAVITDFGMAWSGAGGPEFQLTGSSQMLLGTPEYMSPEQIEGKTLTAASDIYSLGLIAYQMVTGARAFAADTPLYSALRRLTEPPLLPSRIQPDLDRRWDAILSRCLDREPARRFSSAGELANSLADNVLEPLPRVRTAWRRVPELARRALLERHRMFAAGALAVCLAAAGAVLLYMRAHRRPASAGSLTIVLADFVNTTGDPAFDNGLNIALAAKLQQSPFLELMPEARVSATLRYMGRPARERLTETLARQVCIRGGGQAVLQGSIASSAKGYIVSLRAVNCASGSSIAARQSSVEFRDSVLDALDRTTESLRPDLGESADSIRRYDVPLYDATTSSVEALAAYSQGTDQWNRQGEAAALPYFLRATEIDPNFALAWARLGTIYGNMGETQRANDALRNAYDRRNRVTEWERYYIVSHYYGFVTGEVDKEMRAYEEWARAYPHDMAWTINLGVDYGFTGQFDKAIELQRQVLREIPGLSPAYGDLAGFYLAVDRPDEARAILDEAKQLHVLDVNIQLGEYDLAFYRGDAAAMNKLLADASQQPGVEDTLLAQQAATQDRLGRLSSGREFASRAAAVAARAGEPEASANWLATEAVRQAELGAAGHARRLAAQALAVPNAARGTNVQVLAALASAEIGDRQRAEALLDAVSKARPLDTLIQSYWAPILRARIAFSEGKFAQAVRLLDGASAYDLGAFIPGQCMDAAFLRGQALLADGQGSAAGTEFRSVLAHRGLVLTCPTGALSQLGLARSLAVSGDTAGSRTAYQDLFVLWKDADADFSLLRRAQAEYRSLR
jgi:tetratricopeptide (TPR) repeat protein